eukprot:scaffold144465_cov30-Tisochrysis_lutea.AAC.4
MPTLSVHLFANEPPQPRDPALANAASLILTLPYGFTLFPISASLPLSPPPLPSHSSLLIRPLHPSPPFPHTPLSP